MNITNNVMTNSISKVGSTFTSKVKNGIQFIKSRFSYVREVTRTRLPAPLGNINNSRENTINRPNFVGNVSSQDYYDPTFSFNVMPCFSPAQPMELMLIEELLNQTLGDLTEQIKNTTDQEKIKVCANLTESLKILKDSFNKKEAIQNPDLEGLKKSLRTLNNLLKNDVGELRDQEKYEKLSQLCKLNNDIFFNCNLL